MIVVIDTNTGEEVIKADNWKDAFMLLLGDVNYGDEPHDILAIVEGLDS